MSQTTPTAEPERPISRSNFVGRIVDTAVGCYVWIDDHVVEWGRDWAYRVHHRLMPIVLLAIGALMIWAVSKPLDMLMRLTNGIDCVWPTLGSWMRLSCMQAPAFRGIAWLSLAGAIVLWFLFMVLFFVLIWMLGRLFVGFSSRVLQSGLDEVNPADVSCKVLVLGLSSLPRGTSPEQAMEEARQWKERWDLYAGPAVDWRREAGRDVLACAGGWQQAARMVAVHLNSRRLRRIYVLPSGETLSLFEDFKSYLTTLFEIPIKRLDAPLDIRPVTANSSAFEDTDAGEGRQRSYDNYRYVTEGLRRAIEIGENEVRRVRAGDICIDATAGFKLFSIAAAVATIDRNVLLGYVVTGGGGIENPEEGVVKLYDARVEFIGAASRRIAQALHSG